MCLEYAVTSVVSFHVQSWQSQQISLEFEFAALEGKLAQMNFILSVVHRAFQNRFQRVTGMTHFQKMSQSCFTNLNMDHLIFGIY